MSIQDWTCWNCGQQHTTAVCPSKYQVATQTSYFCNGCKQQILVNATGYAHVCPGIHVQGSFAAEVLELREKLRVADAQNQELCATSMRQQEVINDLLGKERETNRLIGQYEALLKQTMTDHWGGHSPCHCVEISKALKVALTDKREGNCTICDLPMSSESHREECPKKKYQ